MVIRTLGFLALPIVFVACGGAAFKDITFDMQENGKTVTVKKFYNDGFGGDNAAHQAFEAAQKNDVEGAKKILVGDIALHPDNEWSHYNLAILDEATGDWGGAESELVTAQKVENDKKVKVVTNRFADELKFVRAHKK